GPGPLIYEPYPYGGGGNARIQLMGLSDGDIFYVPSEGSPAPLRRVRAIGQKRPPVPAACNL
ncbi:MAG TPA: hypothetical protein VFQ61_31255, partial [Polyangiaceae bacterium]|nr:hypothetical protein [Polyangiaceae bacterium]